MTPKNRNFSWFQPHNALRHYRGNLPHWRQPNCLYFITFRLGDSIPKPLKLRWIDDNRRWLEAHQISGYPKSPAWRTELSKLPPAEQAGFRHLNQHRIFNALDDGHGSCLLQHTANLNILSEALIHFNDDRYRSGDFIIMPNHIHWLVQPYPNDRLEDIVHSIKRFTARKINQLEHRTGSLWQKEFYDRIVRNEEELQYIRNYIATNASKAHLNSSHYALHQASWLN